MSDFAPPDPEDAIDVRQLANAIRLIAFGIVLGLSWLTFFAAGMIGQFETIFHDMLGGKPLPLITQLVIEGRMVLYVMASIIPAVAIGALLTRRIVGALYVLAALAFLAVGEFSVIYTSLVAPLVEIIRQMSSAPA